MAHDPASGARSEPPPQRSGPFAPHAPWESLHWEDQVLRDARITEASARATVRRTGLFAGTVLLLAGAGSLWALVAAATGRAPFPVASPRSLPPAAVAALLLWLLVAVLVTAFGFLAMARQQRRLSVAVLALAGNQAALARGAAETAELARGLRFRLYAGATSPAAPASAPAPAPASAPTPAPNSGTSSLDAYGSPAAEALKRVGVRTVGDLLFWDLRALAHATGLPEEQLVQWRVEAERALVAPADGTKPGLPR